MTDFAPHDQWLVGSDFTDYFFVANNKMKNYLINASIPENKNICKWNSYIKIDF